MITLDALHELYAYHDAQNARIWDSIAALDDAQFVQTVPYGIGSLRNHVIHLASVDQRWLARVAGTPLPDRLHYDDYPTRDAARTAWDSAQQRVHVALDALTADDLPRTVTYTVRRVDPPRMLDASSRVWQILLHVVTHSIDHRAQMLRILHELGAPTFEQDYMIHLWDTAE